MEPKTSGTFTEMRWGFQNLGPMRFGKKDDNLKN
jgi:hypothetical protein